tara:strand:+ start:144 stop:275 length:132 start_codon:yes stop_codon:yes gene_type:complete
MVLITLLAFFGNMYQYQLSFDNCEKENFKKAGCSFHKEMVKRK